MRLQFHGGLLLVAISAAAQAKSLVNTADDSAYLDATLAQTNIESGLALFSEKADPKDVKKEAKAKSKEDKPSGIMAGLGEIMKGVGK